MGSVTSGGAAIRPTNVDRVDCAETLTMIRSARTPRDPQPTMLVCLLLKKIRRRIMRVKVSMRVTFLTDSAESGLLENTLLCCVG